MAAGAAPGRARRPSFSALSRSVGLEFFEDDAAGQDVLNGSFEELRIPLPHGLHIRSKLLGEIHDDVDEATVG